MMKCEVCRDLLPLYIDNLTSEVTNQEIEEHLKNCEVCQEFYEQMSSDVGAELKEHITAKKNGAIDYLRKIKRSTVKQVLAAVVAVGVFAGIFFFLFGVGFKVNQDEIELKAETIGDEYTIEVTLKDGKMFDLVMWSSIVSEGGNFEVKEKVCKVLHNPFDDVGDSATVGGKVSQSGKWTFEFTDGEVTYKSGKLISEK